MVAKKTTTKKKTNKQNNKKSVAKKTTKKSTKKIIKKTNSFLDELIYDLDNTSKQIILTRYNNPGLNQEEIAKRIGVHHNTVYNKLSSDKVKRIIAEIDKDAFQVIKEHQAKVARKFIDTVMRSKNEKTIVTGAPSLLKDILAEKKELKKVDEFNPVKYLGKEEVDELIEEE